jgi:predicted PolB exonuclease-like 3'-5' exonuclease
MNNNSQCFDKVNVIFEDKRSFAKIGGYRVSGKEKVEVIYYNNGEKRFYVDGELKNKERMTSNDIKFVELQRTEEEKEWKETKRLQEEYRKEIEAGITW